MPGPCKELQQHQWSSGRIHRRRRCEPGSFPGSCKLAAHDGELWQWALKCCERWPWGGMCKPCAERKKEGQQGNRQQPLPCFLACVMAPVVCGNIQASHACAPGLTPGGRICLAAIREGVLRKKEFAPIRKHPALVGWEEWGKRQTGNGKGKHEMAGRV